MGKRNFKTSRMFAALPLLGVILSGCVNLEEFTGTYFGSITLQRAGEMTGTMGRSILQEQVRVDASSSGSHDLLLTSNNRKSLISKNWNWQIHASHSGPQMVLKADGPVPYEGRLMKVTDFCFESDPDQREISARLCLEKDTQATFEIQNSDSHLTLTLTRTPNAVSPFENPSTYSSAQLRDRARNLSFTSRAEFERLTNAKLNAKLRYLNLLPHLSTGSVLAAASFSGAPGLISSIGDIAPFLLPTRWLQAREADHLAEGQRHSLLLMQLNAMQIVEGLSVSVARDISMQSLLKQDRSALSQILQEIFEIEEQLRLPLGSSLSLKSIGNNVDQIVSSLESLVALEMTDLAQAAGFANPEAVSSVQVHPSGDIRNPSVLNLKALQARAIQQAPELLQIDSLIRAAEISKVSRGFQWLDPSGDSQGGLGFALPTYIEIGASAIRQLQISRDQINATLLRKVTDAFHDYQGWLDSYRLASEGVEIQSKRILAARPLLYTANAVYAVQELRDALQQLSVNHMNLLAAEYAWYTSISRINRILRVGAYTAIERKN